MKAAKLLKGLGSVVATGAYAPFEPIHAQAPEGLPVRNAESVVVLDVRCPQPVQHVPCISRDCHTGALPRRGRPHPHFSGALEDSDGSRHAVDLDEIAVSDE